MSRKYSGNSTSCPLDCFHDLPYTSYTPLPTTFHSHKQFLFLQAWLSPLLFFFPPLSLSLSLSNPTSRHLDDIRTCMTCILFAWDLLDCPTCLHIIYVYPPWSRGSFFLFFFQDLVDLFPLVWNAERAIIVQSRDILSHLTFNLCLWLLALLVISWSFIGWPTACLSKTSILEMDFWGKQANSSAFNFLKQFWNFFFFFFSLKICHVLKILISFPFCLYFMASHSVCW